MIEIGCDVKSGPHDHDFSTIKTYINEKTISGLTPIKCEPYWQGWFMNKNYQETSYKDVTTPRYVFTVYFHGNSESFSYRSQQVAQDWYDHIKGYLSNN
jgi:hypothetical protein